MEKRSILLVDDREENLLALESLLEDSDLELVKTTSGNEALGLLLERNFALVLLDVQMPEMDGFEVAAIMRGYAQTRYIPIIFITAISREEKYVQLGHEAGAVDYLTKPIDPLVLRSKVRVFCELDRHKRKLQVEVAERRRAEEALQRAKEGLENTNRELQAEMAERRRIEEALREAERVRVLAETAGAAAHEINQPLTALLGISDLLLMHAEVDPSLREQLEMLKEAGRRIATIVRNMKSIERYETQDYVQGKKIVDFSASSRTEEKQIE